jgi:hypothetical protein
MNNYMKSTRKNYKDLDPSDEEVIEVRTNEGESRVCDYCNTMLIDENGTAIRTAYLTDFGLICGDCIGDVEAQAIYPEGESVLDEDWYQEGIYRD